MRRGAPTHTVEVFQGGQLVAFLPGWGESAPEAAAGVLIVEGEMMRATTLPRGGRRSQRGLPVRQVFIPGRPGAGKEGR